MNNVCVKGNEVRWLTGRLLNDSNRRERRGIVNVFLESQKNRSASGG